MTMTRLMAVALVLVAVSACRVDMRDSGASDNALPGEVEVTGTYFAADSGHNLGKDWCYSGALVLDSTHHFGSVITMCGDEGGGPVTEHIHGTYHLRTVSTRVKGQRARIRRVQVVLNEEGTHSKTHTLRYDNGTLRFDEPWWLGAGLRALDVADPVLKRVPDSLLPDSAAAASSTPSGISKGTVLRAPKKSSKSSPK